jgi:hypothetical protein
MRDKELELRWQCKNRISPKITGDKPLGASTLLSENRLSLLISHGPLTIFPLDPTNRTPASSKSLQPIFHRIQSTTELCGQQSENETAGMIIWAKSPRSRQQTTTKQMSRDS